MGVVGLKWRCLMPRQRLCCRIRYGGGVVVGEVWVGGGGQGWGRRLFTASLYRSSRSSARIRWVRAQSRKRSGLSGRSKEGSSRTRRLQILSPSCCQVRPFCLFSLFLCLPPLVALSLSHSSPRSLFFCRPPPPPPRPLPSEGNLDVIPVLSNLAVSPASRGQGVAQRLCAEVETVVKGWGYSEMLLLVEEQNEPACRLYEKLGYTERWLDSEGSALRVEGATLVERVAPTRAMFKALS